MKKFTIGVTGHRLLPDIHLSGQAIHSFFSDINIRFAARQRNTEMVLLSPLAEGADRVAAKEWLKFSSYHLECPLPLPVRDYIQDFKAEESKNEFLSLLASSRNTIIMPKQTSRFEAYKAVGHYIVDRCDLLLALWNGMAPTNGAGAAAIVNYAISNRKPLCWIHSECPEIVTHDFSEEIFKD